MFSCSAIYDSLATPWAPLSLGFPKQEYSSGLPFPSPGNLPNPGIELVSPAFQADSLPLNHHGNPLTRFVVVQSLGHIQLFATPWTTAHQASLSFTISWSLLNLMSIESAIPSNHLILYCPLLLLPSIFPSIKVFSSESTLHIRWPKYWSFSFSISPSSEYSGLTSFRIDWFDLLVVQGTLKSLLQHNLKASILWHWTFFMVQLSHPYMTSGKTIALTIWTFVGKVMSLLFNTLSRFVIAFLPRSKHKSGPDF